MYDKAVKRANGCGGFTLVELLIALAVASIVMGAAYTVFSSHQKTYTNQKAVVEIQQNLRAGMYFLTREVRLAGYQEDGQDLAGFVQAKPGILQFTMDIFDSTNAGNWDEIGNNDDSLTSSGENVIYSLSDDGDGDGLPDTLTAGGTPVPDVLQRTDVVPGDTGTLMENVEAIGFAYAFDADSDGYPDFTDTDGDGVQDADEATIWAVDTNDDDLLDTSLDTNNDGEIDTNDTAGGVGLASTGVGSTVAIERIRMVRVWMLVRSPVADSKVRDNQTYVLGYGRVTVNDNYRRRLLSESVVCRNMRD